MENLMNVDSTRLILAPIDPNVKKGDFIYTKGETITNFGRTWKVEKVTPKQVHVVAWDAWYPVFKKTNFGRIAKGEVKDRVAWLNEFTGSQKGKLRAKYWKTGKCVGDSLFSHVVLF